jgi:hypothetical protein
MEGMLKVQVMVPVAMVQTWTTLNLLAMINPLATITNAGRTTIPITATTVTVTAIEEAETIMILDAVDTDPILEAGMNIVPKVDAKLSEVESLMLVWDIEEETILEPPAMLTAAKVSQVETIMALIPTRINRIMRVTRVMPVAGLVEEESTAAVVVEVVRAAITVVVEVRAVITVVVEVEVLLQGTLTIKALTAVWTPGPTQREVISRIGNRVKRCSLPLLNTKQRPIPSQKMLQVTRVKRKTL